MTKSSYRKGKKTMVNQNWAVFFDRDGTVIVGPPRGKYLTRVDQIKLMPGIKQAMVHINQLGGHNIVITNQAAVAYGMIGLDEMHNMNIRVHKLLPGLLYRTYFCPHHWDARRVKVHRLLKDCDCRKPKPGMILQAIREFNLDPARCWLVGDADTDIQAAEAAGISQTIFLKSPHNKEERRRCQPKHEIERLEKVCQLIR